jgi:hypothetical protein
MLMTTQSINFDTVCDEVTLLADLSRFWTAARRRHMARRELRQGYRFTAAMQWRLAAEMLYEEPSLRERCWHEWELIMDLPRRWARPVGSEVVNGAAVSVKRQAAA